MMPKSEGARIVLLSFGIVIGTAFIGTIIAGMMGALDEKQPSSLGVQAAPKEPTPPTREELEARDLNIARNKFHPVEELIRMADLSSGAWLNEAACFDDRGIKKDLDGVMYRVDVVKPDYSTERITLEFCVDRKNGSLVPNNALARKLTLDPDVMDAYRSAAKDEFCSEKFGRAMDVYQSTLEQMAGGHPEIHISTEGTDTSDVDFICVVSYKVTDASSKQSQIAKWLMYPNTDGSPIVAVTETACKADDWNAAHGDRASQTPCRAGITSTGTEKKE